MRNLIVCGAVVVLVCATTPVVADTVYLASHRYTLYRTAGGSTESFTLDDRLFSLHAEQGTETVYAIGRSTMMYVLKNAASGTPSLVPLSNLSRYYGSVTRIGDLFYGSSQGNLYTIDVSDPSNPIETFIGSTGLTGTGGAAYDSATDTLYMGSYATDSLYEVDRSNAAVTPVGSMGIDIISLGMEWWDDTVYIAAQNATSGNYEIGTLDPNTGAYSLEFALPPPAAEVATALAIIPEPASAAVFACAALLANRRRYSWLGATRS